MEYTTLSNAKGEEIEGPLLFTPNVFNDERGYFYESWNEKTFNKIIRAVHKLRICEGGIILPTEFVKN